MLELPIRNELCPVTLRQMQWKSDTAQLPEHAASLIGKLRASFANGLIIVLKPLKRFFVFIS